MEQPDDKTQEIVESTKDMACEIIHHVYEHYLADHSTSEREQELLSSMAHDMIDAVKTVKLLGTKDLEEGEKNAKS